MGFKEITVAIDAGSSLTKNFSIDVHGEEKFEEFNNYIIEHDGKKDTRDYVAEEAPFEAKLDLSIIVKANASGEYKVDALEIINELNNKRWLTGELAQTVSNNARQISATGSKFSQPAFYLNIISSIVRNMKTMGLNEVKVNLGTLLPPRDYFKKQKRIINEVLGGEIRVTNNLTNEEFIIHIDKEEIEVKSEAVVAFATCFIGSDGKLTEIGQNYAKKFNIAVDLGDTTADLSVLDEGKPKSFATKTYNKSGRALMQYLKNQIEERFAYSPPLEELRKAFNTGYLTMGNGSEWVGEEISAANEEYVNEFAYWFTDTYLIETGIQLPQVAAFMFIGGGSHKVEKITSVAEHFMRKIRDICKTVNFYSPPNIRLANIYGLAFLMRQKRRKQLTKEQA